jgi:MoxR-like ATPase
MTQLNDQLISNLTAVYGETVTRQQLIEYAASSNTSLAAICKSLEPHKSGRGVWNLTAVETLEKTFNSMSATPATPVISFIPQKDKNYVSFGNFTDVKRIVKSGMFYPVFITGLSGNGKTVSVEQACAQLKRELIRVNITIETDEDDLLGGFRLVDGETVWHDGPVVNALKRGAVLLLDEIDLASNKIMCLQSVLEGKGVFLKKINQYVTPSAGFNVIATANTKGKGSDDGRFIGTNVMNEAFLERFPITFEQPYPSMATEKKILMNLMNSFEVVDEEFVDKLIVWADTIRKTFYDGGVDEIITTRRLVHIIQSFAIFKNRKKAINVCINRFDDDTKSSFLDLYKNIDASDLDTTEEATPETTEEVLDITA